MERDERSAYEHYTFPDNSRQVNRTYVVPELSKSILTLQRRSRINTGDETAEKRMVENIQNIAPAPEERLTLQRRIRTNSVGKSSPDHREVTGAGLQPTLTVLGETTPFVHLASDRQDQTDMLINPSASIGRQVIGNHLTFKRPAIRPQMDAVFQKRIFFEELARSAVMSRPQSSEVPDQQVNTSNKENISVTVAVRIRPFTARETKSSQVVYIRDQETIWESLDSKQRLSFNFDFAFSSVDENDPAFASQQTVYEKVARPLLLKALKGFNVCIFAYGQTGSGKSYTMMGSDRNPGIVLRFCQELFSKLPAQEDEMMKSTLELSYYEIYNEKIHDLLATQTEPSSKNVTKLPLKVREHPVHGTYVADLSKSVVTSEHDIQGWLTLGNKRKATASTWMNEKSSRSHSVLTLILRQTKTELVDGQQHSHCITSKINLIDLAGSERSSWPTNSDRLRESKNINKSLLTLGKVISALSEHSVNKARVFVPYRESVLTWLLKDSLGGNSQTAMIATVSPAKSCMSESLSTLRYAQKTNTIINVANINEDTSSKLLNDMKKELAKLHAMLRSAETTDMDRVTALQNEIFALKQKLLERDREISEANRALEERRCKAEARKCRETVELQKVGVTFHVDNHLPSLVNLNKDPQLSETLIYIIKKGQTTVGKLNTGQDIQLNGALIADHHCTILNVQDIVSIIPSENAKTYINGNTLTESTVLHHGDRVILGGTQYFRFNHPLELQALSSEGNVAPLKDFEFAQNEFLAALNPALIEAIEQDQIRIKQDMLKGIDVAQQLALKEPDLEKEEGKNKRTLRQPTTQTKRLCKETEAKPIFQCKIIEALEEQKKKITKELEDIFEKASKKTDGPSKNVPTQWQPMQMSLLIEEANEICKRLNNSMVFSRHEVRDKLSKDVQTLVRVQNTSQGITTFWTLDKFNNKMVMLRELEQEDPMTKDDIFYDADTEWEHDMSLPSANISDLPYQRKERLSQRFFEKQVQRFNETGPQSADGATTSAATFCTTGSDLPSVCIDILQQTLSQFDDCSTVAQSVASKLVHSLTAIQKMTQIIIGLYTNLGDNNVDNLFAGNKEAQAALIRGTAIFDSAQFVTMQWVGSFEPCGSNFPLAENLQHHVTKMGEYLLLLIKGCESDITAIVMDIQKKMDISFQAALATIGHLVAVTDMPLQTLEPGTQAIAKGMLKGVHHLFRETLTISTKLWGYVLAMEPVALAQRRLKLKGVNFLLLLKKYIHGIILEIESVPEDKRYAIEEEMTPSLLQDLQTLSTTVIKVKHAITGMHASLSRALQGGDDLKRSSADDNILSLFAAISHYKVANFPLKIQDNQQLVVAFENLYSGE